MKTPKSKHSQILLQISGFFPPCRDIIWISPQGAPPPENCWSKAQNQPWCSVLFIFYFFRRFQIFFIWLKPFQTLCRCLCPLHVELLQRSGNDCCLSCTNSLSCAQTNFYFGHTGQMLLYCKYTFVKDGACCCVKARPDKSENRRERERERGAGGLTYREVNRVKWGHPNTADKTSVTDVCIGLVPTARRKNLLSSGGSTEVKLIFKFTDH